MKTPISKTRQVIGGLSIFLTLVGLLAVTGCDQSKPPENSTPTKSNPSTKTSSKATTPPSIKENKEIHESKTDQPADQPAGQQAAGKSSGKDQEKDKKKTNEQGKGKATSSKTTKKEKSKTDKGAQKKDPIDAAIAELNSKPVEDPTEPREIPTPDTFKPEKGWIRLLKGKPLWIDKKKNQVIADGYICQTNAPLEMLAFPYTQGKGHEAVAAIYCDSKSVHAALLAVGARPGKPVSFQDEYRAAFGTKIKIQFQYKDSKGKIRTEDARSWIREFRTKKPLQTDWVFAGSDIYVDPETNERHYLADNGEMVCVSNFSTALLDIPVQSSQANTDLVYQANPEKVPPKETPIRMILIPDLSTVPKKAETKPQATKQPEKKEKEDSKKEK